MTPHGVLITKCTNDPLEPHNAITGEITDERNEDMARSITEKRENAVRAHKRLDSAGKTLESLGLGLSNLNALDRELSAQSEQETLEIEAKMNELSQVAKPVTGLDVEAGFLPDGAQILKPSWVAAFADDDLQDEQTQASVITAQSLLSGGGCKDYYNWAKGAGSGLFGTGEGKIQSWVDFGFWFKPEVSRFYSIRPLFRFRGYVIVKADDGIFTSKFARVTGSAWTNVYQYNWKGWNHVDVYNLGDDNINTNRRMDLDRYTYNSYLLGAGDWAYIRCTIGLHAYARGSGSYAKNDFATGAANYLCVPHVYVV
jgi:hypothetical protein